MSLEKRKMKGEPEQQQKSQKESQTEWWEAKAWVLEISTVILENDV